MYKEIFCSGKKISVERDKPLVSTIMEEVVNGTEVIEAGLNSCLLATTESPKSIDFAIKIDFLRLFSRKTKRQCTVIDEILDMIDNFDSAQLVKHPVIAIFIWAKWRKIKKYYYLHALLYIAFLLSYSIMVYQLFGTGGNKVPIKECNTTTSSNGDPPEEICVLKFWFKIPMILILAVLTLYNIYKACKLRSFEEPIKLTVLMMPSLLITGNIGLEFQNTI